MCAIARELLGASFYDARGNCAASNTVMTIAYDIATVAVAGMMAGNEFAVAAFVHPQLRRLADSAHAQTAALLAGVLGKAMPPGACAHPRCGLRASPSIERPWLIHRIGRRPLGSDNCVYSNNARSDQQSNREDESGAPL